MKSALSLKSTSTNDEDLYRYDFENYKNCLETAAPNSYQTSTESGKSLAYYLDFYNKKHTILSLESNQNFLNQNLRQHHLRCNDQILKTNNQLLNGNSKPKEESITSSNVEFNAPSYSESLRSHRGDTDLNLKNKLKQKEIVNDFMKFNKPKSDQETENLTTKFKNLSNNQNKQFQQHKKLLIHSNNKQDNNFQMHSLMDYTKQEDRLANNKYHYYIKHYLNDKNQSKTSENTNQKGNKQNSNSISLDSSRRNNRSFMGRNDDNQIDFDINSPSSTLSRHQSSLNESQNLQPPKISILKNLKSKANTGSNSKKKPCVVEIRLAGQEFEDSRLSFTSGIDHVNKSTNESIKPDSSTIFSDFNSESEHKYSQNRQFLDRIQKVYNRKFKGNSNKTKTNQTLIEKPTNQETSKINIDTNKDDSNHEPTKKNFLPKTSRYNRNAIHPDTNIKSHRSNENFKYDSISTFNSEHYSIPSNPSIQSVPRVEFNFGMNTNQEKSRLNPIKNKENSVFLKMNKPSVTKGSTGERSLIVNDFLREIIVENLSETDSKKSEQKNKFSSNLISKQTNSLSVIDLADLDQIPRNNFNSAFKPMRLNDYIKNSRSRHVKKLNKLKVINTAKIAEETEYQGYSNPSNSVLDDQYTEDTLTNVNTNSTMTLGSKKRVSFHENVLETDVNSGSSVYRLLL